MSYPILTWVKYCVVSFGEKIIHPIQSKLFYVSLRDCRLYVRDYAEGKTIVWVHGWPFNHRMFMPYFRKLSTVGVRSIAYDLRGFGESHQLDGNQYHNQYNYDVFTQDLNNIITFLKLKDVTLCGFSMGAAIALLYLYHYPNSVVNKLILLGAAAPCFSWKRKDLPINMKTFIPYFKKNPTKWLNYFVNLFFYRKNYPQLTTGLVKLGLQARFDAVIQLAEELLAMNLEPVLKYIDKKTLILHGEEDGICPIEFSTRLHNTIANAKLITFSKAGHGFIYEKYLSVVDQLVHFMAAS